MNGALKFAEGITGLKKVMAVFSHCKNIKTPIVFISRVSWTSMLSTVGNEFHFKPIEAQSVTWAKSWMVYGKLPLVVLFFIIVSVKDEQGALPNILIQF